MRPIKSPLILLLAAIILAAELAAGCTGSGSIASPTPSSPTTTGTPQTVSPDTVVLTVNGSVSNLLNLTTSDLYTYPTVPVNLSETRPGPGNNISGDGGMVLNDGNGMPMPAGMDGNLPSGAVGYRVGPDGGYYISQDGSMTPATGGNIPVGPGGSMPSGNGGTMMFNVGNATGISLNALLDKANPPETATNVTFVGAGDRVEAIPLSAIRAQADAAVVIIGPGTLQAILPDGRFVMDLTGIIVSQA